VIATIEKEDLFNQVLAQNKGRFLFIARQYASISEAQDLYQEIVYQLWEGLNRFEGRSTPETWAYRIALNTASAYRRNNNRREQALRAYKHNLETEQMGGRGEAQMLREFAQSLPDMERKLLTLYLAKLSYQDIAKVADISEINLRVKISRLRNQFEQRYL
jgi:RNA polymerase sigma-70 factor, ECF subfamily